MAMARYISILCIFSTFVAFVASQQDPPLVCVKQELNEYEIQKCNRVCPEGYTNEWECREECHEFKIHEQICCDGYARQGGNENCTDINECEWDAEGKQIAYLKSKSPVCNSTEGHEFCSNRIGTYDCLCEKGYERPYDDAPFCVDVDECKKDLLACGEANCINLPGTFKCTCDEGYQSLEVDNEDIKCVDINECDDVGIPNPCQDANTRCVNTAGSFKCICDDGFEQQKGVNYCADIDECMNPDLKAKCNNGICFNTHGSFECRCAVGLVKNDTTQMCDDIDECYLGMHNCSNNLTCQNTHGSYKCAPACPVGFEWHEEYGCLDLNECSIKDANLCSHYCHNERGNYSCSCPFLYKLGDDEVTCIYGFIDDDILLVMMGALAISSILILICVCVCASRLFKRPSFGRRSPYHYHVPSPNSSALSYSLKEKQKMVYSEGSPPNFNASTQSSNCSAASSSEHHPLINDVAPDYPGCQLCDNHFASLPMNYQHHYPRAASTAKRPHARPVHSISYHGGAATLSRGITSNHNYKPRPVSTLGAVPSKDTLSPPFVHDSILAMADEATSSSVGEEVIAPDYPSYHSDTTASQPSYSNTMPPTYERKAVLLPRYACTDDECPTVALLDENLEQSVGNPSVT